MTDSFEHNPGDHEDPLPGPTWTIGIIGAILLAVSLLGLAALFYERTNTERDVKVLAVTGGDLAHGQAVQDARLAGVRLEKRVEGEDSLVIPIDRAMKHLVEEGAGD